MMFTAANRAFAEMAARQSMESNQVQAIVLTIPDFVSIVQDKVKNNPAMEASVRKVIAGTDLAKFWRDTAYPNASNTPWLVPASQTVVDAALITRTLGALKYAGFTSYTSVNAAGHTTIILKGYAALRDAFLGGTTFLASNPKMIQLGLGMRGVTNVAKGGFMLGLVVSIGIESTDYILNDEKTMYDLVGAIGVEAVKGGLAMAFGMVAAAAVGFAFSTAVLPLFVLVVGVGFAAYKLNEWDNQYKIKDTIIATLKELPETVGAIGRRQATALDLNVKQWVGRRF